VRSTVFYSRIQERDPFGPSKTNNPSDDKEMEFAAGNIFLNATSTLYTSSEGIIMVERIGPIVTESGTLSTVPERTFKDPPMEFPMTILKL
jgi:hypothetical protein